MSETQRLSHAYILAGPEEARRQRSLTLAKTMLCEGPADRRPCGLCRSCRKCARGVHPDLQLVTRRTDEKGKLKREIYVDQIRELVSSAWILPNDGERKVYIVADAGTMNPAAQNAFLKLLEEPPAFVSLLLECDSADQLLETVRSRCVLEHVRGEETEPSAEARERAERFLDLAAAEARVSMLSFTNGLGDLSGQELTELAQAARGLLADVLCGRLPDRKMPRTRLMALSRLMDKTEEYLRFNVSPKHVLGMLSVEAFKKE